MQQEKRIIVIGGEITSGLSFLNSPITAAYLKTEIEREEKAAREKARGMTDEEWKQANEEINRNILNAGKSLGENAKEAALQIQTFIDMVTPYLPDRPKHSKNGVVKRLGKILPYK